MQRFRTLTAAALILPLAGQVVVRPLHHHDKVTAERASAESVSACHLCGCSEHQSEPVSSRDDDPRRPAAPHDPQQCSICHFLSCWTVTTAPLELPLTGGAIERPAIGSAQAPGAKQATPFDVRGPPRG